jgi:hypothetical protein
MRRPWLSISFMALAFAGIGHARVNVVTLPDRNSVQLTIYNSVDLTLVRERRRLTFREGINRLEFSWANTLIDPTSVEFRAVTHTDAIDVLDISFPPRAANTLEWRINSEVAGEVWAEIRYFTSGIRWSADYVAEAARNEQTMALSGHVRVDNRSGEDYENAEVRLVVGVVRLVEKIADLSRARKESRDHFNVFFENLGLKRKAEARLGEAIEEKETMANEPLDARQVTKESLSEYFLYTVEGRDTIPNGWGKRLPSFRATDVPVQSLYQYERETYGDRVIRFYRFTNSMPARLGTEPLPDGAVHAFRVASDDRLYDFTGSTRIKYVPINEQADLELGADREVMVAPAMTNWSKTELRFDNRGNVSGWTERQWWQVEVQNSKEIPVMLDLRRNFSGDWEIASTTPCEKVDATKVKFLMPLNPRQRMTFSYSVIVRHGTNARR